MKHINSLINIINNKINVLNNKIEKNEIINILSNLSSKVNKTGIWEINGDDVNKLTLYLKENKLELRELQFINSISILSDETKNTMKNLLGGINDKQLTLLESIKNKITLEIENEKIKMKHMIDSELTVYKELLKKIDGRNEIITELDIISKLLDEAKLDLNSQINIYTSINNYNSNIYNNIEMDIDTIDENSLEEKNINEELLNKLFKEFNIDWNKLDNYIKDDKIKEKIINTGNYYKNKLLKYGNYDKIKEILSFLKDNKLDFIFNMPEILTRTLLYSSVNKITNLIKTAKENNFNYIDLLKKQPSMLYPKIRVSPRKKTTNRNKKNNTNINNVTGTLNSFIDNVNFLKKHNIDVSEVYSNCPSFFTKSVSYHEKVYKNLKLYGINLKYPNGNLKKVFSIFDISNILDRFDIVIENGLYDYYQDNLTKLCDYKFNPYRVKYAKSLGLKDNQIFIKKYLSIKGSEKQCLSSDFWKKDSSKYGINFEDTFKLYNSINIEKYISKNNIELYNNIINNHQSDEITELVLNNSIIKKLDSMFKDSNNDLIYNFNGVIISRLKVLRYYETILANNIEINDNLLLYIITYNTMLNEEEINNIKLSINNIKNNGRKV